MNMTCQRVARQRLFTVFLACSYWHYESTVITCVSMEMHVDKGSRFVHHKQQTSSRISV
jgi:hypothetical protein